MHTLDRICRNLREVLNLVHDLAGHAKPSCFILAQGNGTVSSRNSPAWLREHCWPGWR